MNYNGLLDIDMLADYLDGKLDSKAMHEVEKLSLEDPFVAEALAGLSQSALRSQSLSLLQKRLHDRVALKPIENKRWAITSQRLSIASAAAVLFIVVSVLFWMKENSRRQLESNQAKNVNVEIALNGKTVITTTPPVKTEVEIDKVITVAKTNTYAALKEPKVKRKKDEELPAVASAMIMAAEDNEEKVITAKSSARMSMSSVLNSEPINGWEKFEEYILANNKFIKNNQPVGKSVKLSFTIEQNNRPKEIKILSGLSKEENEEAIRLLTDGPSWKYNSNQLEAAVIDIKF